MQTVSDEHVQHIWECKPCELAVTVPPTFYENNGTPLCDCGDDMTYVRTEVDITELVQKIEAGLDSWA